MKWDFLLTWRWIFLISDYNKYFAICQGSTGEKSAGYNVKLKRSLMVDEISNTQVVKVIPDYKELKDRYSIHESMAAVLYHSTQHPTPRREYVIRVINIGETGTNISFVKCSNRSIQLLKSKFMNSGGADITKNMVRVFKRKCGCQLGSVEEKELYKEMEALKISMGLCNKGKSEIEFRGMDVIFTRKEFNICCCEWLIQLLRELDYFDVECSRLGIKKAEATILCGGGSECELIAQKLKEKYEKNYVTNYKASEAAVLGGAIYAKQLFGR